jgi:hypothetical protein
MSTKQVEVWITGEEYGCERRRLIEAGVPDDAPEFRELEARVDARDDFLFERYGKPLIDEHYGKWIGISIDGRVIVRNTSAELSLAAREAFGGGNYSKRKLADFPGYELLS